MHVSLYAKGLRKCNLLSFFLCKVDRSVIYANQYHTSANCRIYLPLNLILYPRCHRSSSAMEQTATDTATPAEVNISMSEENVGAETGKRKSDEPHQTETSHHGKKPRGARKKKQQQQQQLRPGERYVPPPQKRNPGVSFSREHFDETTYYFEGGLRKVNPYYFDFKTYCKGRWVGKSLLEVFKSEFRAESIEYYQKAAREGRIRLNETPVDDLSVVLRVSASI